MAKTASDAIAEAVQPDNHEAELEAQRPHPEPAPEPEAAEEYKVAEVRDDGTVIIEMSDGRMFPVQNDGERPRKGSKVTLAFEKADDGVPVDAKLA